MNWRNVPLAVIVILVCSGCSATKQARSVEQSGFLGHIYPLMQKGQEGEALLVYHHPKAKEKPKGYYKKILLDPVLIYRGQKARMEGVTLAEAQLAADTFYAMIYENLSKDYEMVKKPGPNTLRIQIALVGLEKSNPTLDIISSVPAPYNVLGLSSALVNLSTGKALYKGEAAIESKVSDGHTGKLLYAGIDRRVGGNALNSESFDSWSDVNRAFIYWAEMTRYRLCQSREEKNCIEPES